MRRSIALAVLLLAPFSATAADKKYESESGKYKAAFPAGDVKENTGTAGGLATQQSILQAKGREFEVLFADLPEAAKTLDPKVIFDGGEQGALKDNKRKRLASITFEYGADKLPAREFTVKEGKVVARAVMILKDNRLYVLTMTGPDNFTTAKEAYTFFESFEFTK